MMKAKSVSTRVMDRPYTLKSGVALQSNYSVQHRSDILMEEQIDNVKLAQESLRKSLSDLEVAKTEEEIDRCREEVQEMKEKSEKSIMVLKVLNKVNTELNFARAELDEALDFGQGDINEARKRVMWLEDRMGMLCGKKRLRGQPVQRQKGRIHSVTTSDYRGRMDSGSSSDHSSSDGPPDRMGRNRSIAFRSDTTRRPDMFTPSESGSDYPYDPQVRPGMMSTPSSDAGSFIPQPQLAPGMGPSETEDYESDDEDEEETGGMSIQVVTKPQAPASGTESAMSDRSSEVQDSVSDLPQQFQKSMIEMPTQASLATSEETEEEYEPTPVPQESQLEAEVQDDEEEEAEPQDLHVGDEQPVIHVEEAESPVGRRGEEEDDEVKDHVERSESSSSRSSASSEGAKKKQDMLGVDDKGQTFMTEVSFAKSVTIMSPAREDTRQAFLRGYTEEIGKEKDKAEEYWQSEHHRFEYGDHSEVLCELDPLSYHQVGLAVPGTFLKKGEDTYNELPWRPRRKGSDINDIHKIALDKLSKKVHNMYDKVYDAAMLSVRSLPDQMNRKESTFFTALDKEGTRTMTPSLDGKPGLYTAPPTTADAGSRPVTGARPLTVGTSIVPKLETRRVYYPKPIPPPEVLPLTRTSKDKAYPKLADSFSDLNTPREPAIRIVDQRNLQQETKLTLYRERPKQRQHGPTSTERKFRLMLEREQSSASKSARTGSSVSSKGKTQPTLSRALTKDESDEVSTWSKLKPVSRGQEYTGLRWERVKTLVHTNLLSQRSEERKDAARHLGLLRCGDAMVFYALKERLRADDDQRVRYESAKSLILLGCWDEDVLQMILKYLVMGNTEIRQDLIKTMIDGKNVQYVNKKTPTFPELVKVLSHFCRNPDPEDLNALDAAVLLGRLCVADENAKFKLMRALDQSSDTHIKAKALEILVKQLNCTDWDVVRHLLNLFMESPVWKYRSLAADLLISLGHKNVCIGNEEEKVYLLLEKKLWDDPNKEVRISAAKALTALGMFGKACERIEKRLEDSDEDIRAQAVISVGTLEMKNEKIIRLLLEMLELDSSEYVRLMIARTFAVLKLTDKRVMRALRERDKVEGPLARESRRALKILESLSNLATPVGRKSTAAFKSVTPHAITPKHLTAAVNA